VRLLNNHTHWSNQLYLHIFARVGVAARAS
jgi:hypothetical protein